ncbi:MAG: aldehyde dehydrogenase [Atopobiaceae bacterium]|nr:aldehyde dehydrogenase [Atopobiaceae bacterium]
MAEHTDRVAQIAALVERQRRLFATGETLPIETRISALKALRSGILAHEDRICTALATDLGKSASESYMCEVGLVLAEIGYMLRNVRRLARRYYRHTPLTHQVARCYEQASPLGIVLIISPWNYPFLLTVEPLVDAIAAGNTAIVKPSAYAPATSTAIAQLVRELFPPEYVTCVEGGREENQALLDQPFDLIFFTGSTTVGKVVLQKAAQHVTPVVLELGGKSPCIVDATANVSLAARRIAWGKYLNCGQTCVAPDYVLCDERVADEFERELCREITRQYGASPLQNPNYGKIVNERHFERLRGLLNTGTITFGGCCDASSLRIEPSVMTNVSWDDPVMADEIFGPILPVLRYASLDEELAQVNVRPHPLALYLFSEDKLTVKHVMSTCSFGGGCINDVVLHLATSHMRFGGVGASGMGSYHGDAGFQTFSHVKSIVDRATWADPPLRYQPYRWLSDRLVRHCLH